MCVRAHEKITLKTGSQLAGEQKKKQQAPLDFHLKNYVLITK